MKGAPWLVAPLIRCNIIMRRDLDCEVIREGIRTERAKRGLKCLIGTQLFSRDVEALVYS